MEKRLKLECDGVEIKLPKLQGIVILNIGSFAAGANMWGNKVQKKYRPPSYDDGLLEVVAIKGLTQMAATKTLGLSPTRLAQASHIRITILPGVDVPIQVDGEAWMIQPTVLNIRHKRRVQMLCRDRAFQTQMLKWEATHKPVSRQFLADLTEAKVTLVDSVMMAMMNNADAKGRLAPFVAAVKGSTIALEKAGKKANNAHVVSYLSGIAGLVEGLRACFDFTVPPSPGVDPNRRRSWAEIAPPVETDAPAITLSLIHNGGELQDNLFACEDALSIALQLCDDDPALFEKHRDVEQSASLPRPRPKAHTVSTTDSEAYMGKRPIHQNTTGWEQSDLLNSSTTSDGRESVDMARRPLPAQPTADGAVPFPGGARDSGSSTDGVTTPTGCVEVSSSKDGISTSRPKTIVELRNTEGPGMRRGSSFDDV
jgi:hypothetical protein